MVIVGIDSMILIYAGVVPRKAGAPPFPKELSDSAKLLFQILSRDNATIVLPMISVAELMVPVAQSKKGELLDALKKMFDCRPFDERESVIASHLWALHNAQKPEDKYPKGERDLLKADVMILATAKAAGASRFYTNDDKCRKLANLIGLQGCPVPRRDPNSLFTPKELEGAQKPTGPQSGRFRREKKKQSEG